LKNLQLRSKPVNERYGLFSTVVAIPAVKRMIFTDARRTKVVSAVVTIFVGPREQTARTYGLPPIDRAERQQDSDRDDHDQRELHD
jgi:hypothetical protein